MKLKDNINIRRIGNEDILISSNENNLEYTRIIVLNSSATYLLHETGKCFFSAVLWAELLTNKYGISHEQALADAEKLVAKLKELNVID